MELCLIQNDDFFYKITFEGLDFNNDGFLSEVDLFLALRDIKDNGLLKIISFDLSAIIRYIADKKRDKGTLDDVKYRFEVLMRKLSKLKRQALSKGPKREESTKNAPNNFFEFLTQALNTPGSSMQNSEENSPERSVMMDTPSAATSRRILRQGYSTRLSSAKPRKEEGKQFLLI